jgi:hypothetical protein
MNRSHLLGIGVVLLAVAMHLAAQENGKDKGKRPPTPNYWPLEVGNTWTYKLEALGKSLDIRSTIRNIDKINDMPLARMETTENEEVAGSEHLQQSATGVFRHLYNGVEIEPPICILKYPLKGGEKWKGKGKIGNELIIYSGDAREEEVKVAAGKFKTIRVDLRVDVKGEPILTTYWFAENVGIVRQTVQIGDIDLVMDLQKFERGPAKKDDAKEP